MKAIMAMLGQLLRERLVISAFIAVVLIIGGMVVGRTLFLCVII